MRVSGKRWFRAVGLFSPANIYLPFSFSWRSLGIISGEGQAPAEFNWQNVDCAAKEKKIDLWPPKWKKNPEKSKKSVFFSLELDFWPQKLKSIFSAQNWKKIDFSAASTSPRHNLNGGTVTRSWVLFRLYRAGPWTVRARPGPLWPPGTRPSFLSCLPNTQQPYVLGTEFQNWAWNDQKCAKMSLFSHYKTLVQLSCFIHGCPCGTCLNLLTVLRDWVSTSTPASDHSCQM